jgi:hypothetical protein
MAHDPIKGDAAESYASRDNIGVPDTVPSSAELTDVETAAATRAQERSKSGPAHTGTTTPDAADYNAVASNRG